MSILLALIMLSHANTFDVFNMNGDEGVSLEQIIEVRKETSDFNTNVMKVMNILSKSLYKHKDIVLRELISNSADALDKVKMVYKSKHNKEYTKNDLKIKVTIDKTHKTLTVTDNGIGMDTNELHSNLGTIGSSGTEKFARLAENSDLIGQFGVGFYSSYLIANHIVLSTRKEGDNQKMWISNSKGQYSVADDPRGNLFERGTSVQLKLHKNATDFLDQNFVEKAIKKHSEFLGYPIDLCFNGKIKEKQVELKNTKNSDEKINKSKNKENSKTAENTEKVEEKDKFNENNEIKTKEIDEKYKITVTDGENDGEKDEKSNKENHETIDNSGPKCKRVNNVFPIWHKNPSDVSNQEYHNFYKVLTNSNDKKHLIHFHLNDKAVYNSKILLYMPEKPEKKLFDEYDKSKSQIRLYVKRVLVDEHFEILPRFLKFIVGAVDSTDLDLNINREQIQTEFADKLQTKLKTTILDTILDISLNKPEKFSIIWENYRHFLKMGYFEVPMNRRVLRQIYKFPSTFKPSGLVSFEEYVHRMKTGQEDIFYISGESIKNVENSPSLKYVVGEGYEVLYFVEPLDEYLVLNFKEYVSKKTKKKYKLKSILDEDFTLEKNNSKLSALKAEFAPLCEWLEKILSKTISKVVVSSRLKSEPFLVVPLKNENSALMEKVLRFKSLRENNEFVESKKVLEVNPKNSIIVFLKNSFQSKNTKIQNFAEKAAKILLDSAIINSGFSAVDLNLIANRINDMVEEISQNYEEKFKLSKSVEINEKTKNEL